MIAPDSQRTYVDVIARLGVRNLPPGGEATLSELLTWISEDARQVVDLGCNTGWSTAEIAAARPGAEVIGIDLAAAMVAKARSQHKLPNIRFVEADALTLDVEFPGIDAVVCAGSSAFFDDVQAVYSAIQRALVPTGVFANAHYVYEPDTPIELRQREREAFGVRAVPYSAAECVADYEAAGLTLDTYSRLPRWALQESAAGVFYRSLLATVPSVRDAMDFLLARRALAAELSDHRAPVVVSARNGIAAPPVDVLSTAETVRMMNFFRLPMSPLPLERLRRMLPYELLAYLGDPDTAPGGAASVRRAARLLEGCGLAGDASVLDVGSFTGMSTIALARSFPRTLGIDIEPVFLGASQMLAHVLNSPAQFREMDARRLVLDSGSVDAVVMTATLGYTPDPHELIRQAFRVLRPGGLFVEFFYHHHVRTPEQQALARASVGPDVRLRGLSAQLADVEEAGFGVRAIERVQTPGMSDEAMEVMCAALVEREQSWNPHLRDSELAEFAYLVEQFVGRGFPPAIKPDVYLCLFEKPS